MATPDGAVAQEQTAVPEEVSRKRAALMELFARKLDRYLPESGALKPWTISEIECALERDLRELGRKVTEARIAVDPQRAPQQNRCPKCGRALMGHGTEPAHRQTIFGPLSFERAYGYCRPCGSAFSPSGQRVGLRRGLL
jgi:hypothetical protein